MLCEFLKFDTTGKLVEDVDLERPLTEQDSYRYAYTYDAAGRLIEKAGYGEDGSSHGKAVYSYGSQGRKTEQVSYSAVGRIRSRYEFDEHENITSIAWYSEDGNIRAKEIHRHEYTETGNVLEQIYYPAQVGGDYPPTMGFLRPLGGAEKEASI